MAEFPTAATSHIEMTQGIRHLAWALCVLSPVGLLHSPCARALPTASSALPESIRAPSTAKLIWRVQATGVQIYVCRAASDGKAAWKLQAPQAELRDGRGVVVGRHYAGPTWKHQDGSEVVGKVVAQAPAPQAGAIPWLLVTAVGHSGSGVLARVTSIQRVHTHGGQPPATGCDGSRLGAETQAPYTAEYDFYTS